MAAFKLHHFGPPRASRAGGETVAFPSRRAAALLAYVASQPDRTHDRVGIARLLWAELPARSAQNNLRVTLARLKALARTRSLIDSANGTVSLAPGDPNVTAPLPAPSTSHAASWRSMPSTMAGTSPSWAS